MGREARAKWKRRLQLGEQRLDTDKAPRYQIIVSLLPDGKVNVAGPLDRGEMCYEMLKTAMEVLLAYQKEKVIIQKPLLVGPDGKTISTGG